MKRVAFKNMGCKVNSYEAEAMLQMLEEDGYEAVEFEQVADVYVVNTCTVTNIADRKSRQMLHQAKKRNPEAVVVAVGCYVQTGAEQLLADQSVDLIIGNNKKNEIVSILHAFLQKREENEEISKVLDGETVIDISLTKEYDELILGNTKEHTRAYIKIQDGCNQFCSYCLIPFARGRARSRAPQSVIDEIKGLVEKGYREVVITGIHLSSYGCDFEGACKDENGFAPQELLKLLKTVSEISGLERIRLGSLEPRIITETFMTELKKITIICPHFHLSLQSGCDKTLKAMNRHYTTAQFKEKMMLIRKYFDHPAITTDVITGFPGETEEDFEITRKFLECVRFFEMHIFPYSVRKGTNAAKMSGQLSVAVKEKRSAVLLEMEKKQSRDFREYYLGKEVTVLLEEEKIIQNERYWIGHTPEYVKIAVKGKELCENMLCKGRVQDFVTDDILLLTL